MKETEFDRYERMKKLEREAEVEKRKLLESDDKLETKGNKSKLRANNKKNNRNKSYVLATGDEYDE